MHLPEIKNILRVLFLCSIMLASGSSLSLADSPIYIEADHMSSTEEQNSVLFTGDVDAKQDDLRIRSDKMTVYYQDKGKKETTANATQQIDRLICEGNVEITRAEWLGTSDKMTYLAAKKQVILTGNAKAWQDQNMVAGEKIIYYMDEGRSEVIGGTSVTVGGTEDDASQENKNRVQMRILQQ